MSSKRAYNSAENRRALFEEQAGRCTGCLRPFPYRDLTVDHILPQSKGGGASTAASRPSQRGRANLGGIPDLQAVEETLP